MVRRLSRHLYWIVLVAAVRWRGVFLYFREVLQFYHFSLSFIRAGLLFLSDHEAKSDHAEKNKEDGSGGGTNNGLC